MSNADLKREFFAIASKIKAVCEHKSVSTCTNGKCPFSTENGSCAFDWCNFGSPYEWEFDSTLFANLTEKEKGAENDERTGY